MKEKRSLIFYCQIKLEWAREEYRVCCTRNEKSGLAWFKKIVVYSPHAFIENILNSFFIVVGLR
jgi:hypothetical protein